MFTDHTQAPERFCSGAALVLICWVITPLQSSLLTIAPAVRETRTSLAVAELWSYGSQAEKLDSSFLHSAYGMTWLGDAPVEMDFVYTFRLTIFTKD